MVSLDNAQNRRRPGPDRARQRRSASTSATRRCSRDGTISRGRPSSAFETALRRTPRRSSRRRATTWSSIAEGHRRAASAGARTRWSRSTIAGMVLEVPVEVGQLGDRDQQLQRRHHDRHRRRHGRHDLQGQGRRVRGRQAQAGHGRSLLTIGAIEGQQLEATLEHIAPKGVEEDGAIQFEIRAALKPQPDVFIRANYSANADIVLDRRDRCWRSTRACCSSTASKPFVEVETAPQKFEKPRDRRPASPTASRSRSSRVSPRATRSRTPTRNRPRAAAARGRDARARQVIRPEL